MKLYTQTGTKSTVNEAKKRGLGLMLCMHWYDPNDWNGFAIDNGCYSAWVQGTDWESHTFLRFLSKCKKLGLKPDFIVTPDKVASKDSLDFSLAWNPVLKIMYPEYKQYLAVQDGMNISDVINGLKIGSFDGIFVGGTIDWKLNTMKMWTDFAHEHGVKCHVGRIGTIKRMIFAREIGVDSIDSTTWVQRKDALPRYVDGYQFQTVLNKVKV